MRNFHTIVLILVGDMGQRRRDLTQGCSITSEFICDNFPRYECLAFKQFSEETQRHSFISAALHQNVDDVTILIDRSPKILTFTTYRQKYLIQVPGIAQSALTLAKRIAVWSYKVGLEANTLVCKAPGSIES